MLTLVDDAATPHRGRRSQFLVSVARGNTASFNGTSGDSENASRRTKDGSVGPIWSLPGVPLSFSFTSTL